jgi:SAM-dependent methyltransferase
MDNGIIALSHAKTNSRVRDLVLRDDPTNSKIIDVGAGEGFFSQALGDYIEERYKVHPSHVLTACDLLPEHFKYAKVACEKVNLDNCLPYADNTFDIACSIEVVEHVENQFAFFRELCRIVKPGGRAIVTTPNILNVNSRIKFLHSGFWLLYDPLPLGDADCTSLEGHINPTTFYYLAAMARKAGFRDIRLHFDRTKKSGLALALLFLPFIRLFHGLFWGRFRRKCPKNREFVAQINSLGMLVSRTIILEAVK